MSPPGHGVARPESTQFVLPRTNPLSQGATVISSTRHQPSAAITPRRERRLIASAAAAALLPLFALASPAAAAPPDILEQVAPTPTAYAQWDDFLELSRAGAGNVTATVWAVDFVRDADNGGSGCSADDFEGFAAGSIALLRRDSCLFSVKAANALEAGAVGVLVANDGRDESRMDAIHGMMQTPVDIPAMSTSVAVGEDLRNGVIDGPTGSVVHMVTDGISPNARPEAQLVAIEDAIDEMDLPPTAAQPLHSKIDAAQAALERGNVRAACNQLAAFQNQVRAQSGKALTTAQADELLARSATLRSDLGC